jgi:quercetin dioxygenase-like cupin family protein
MSLAALAASAELTKGFLSQVERDLTSPSVATLLRVCQALELPLGELFDGDDRPLVRSAERVPIVFGGRGMNEYRLTPSHERRVMVLMSEVAPGGGSGEEEYSLASDAEVLHVLDGMLDVQVGGARYRLGPGDTLTFDASTAHSWQNPSTVLPTRVLWVLTPALA